MTTGAAVAVAPMALAAKFTVAHAESQIYVPEPQALKIIVDAPSARAHDPLGQWGFVAYKVTCRQCSRQWGDYQKFSDVVIEQLRFPLPTEEQARHRAVEYLIEDGFQFDRDNLMTCPQCQGKPETRSSLCEGVAPDARDWYIKEWTLPQPIMLHGHVIDRWVF